LRLKDKRDQQAEPCDEGVDIHPESIEAASDHAFPKLTPEKRDISG